MTPLCIFMFMVCTILVTLAIFTLADTNPKATFPLQFSGNLEITAHLIGEDSMYPPHKRRMTLYYDYVNRKARAEVEAGYEAAKYYIRRYDSENEYMVRLPPIDDCKRSFLGEEMPYPDLSEAHFVKEVVIDGMRCNYFLHLEYDIRVHIYMAVDDNAPVRLIQESVEENGTSIPLLTYDYSDVIIGEPEAEWFELPEPYEHKTCTRHIGGFPYLHIFHYFVKF